MELRLEIEQILCESLHLSPQEIAPESEIVDDLGADSLDLVELLMKVEEKYDISIDDMEAEKAVTVQDGINLIQKLIKGK